MRILAQGGFASGRSGPVLDSGIVPLRSPGSPSSSGPSVAASLALVVRHIFRSMEPWARVLQLGLTGVLVMALAARASDPAELPSPGYVFWPGMLGSLSIYARSAAESFRL